MLGEKRKWFKILSWKKYQDLKDENLSLKIDKADLEKEVETLNSEIDNLKYKNLKINDLQNQIEKKELEFTQLKKHHAEEKSDLKKELKEVKDKLKDLEEKGVVVPKKIPGTKAKPQKMKETVRPVKN